MCSYCDDRVLRNHLDRNGCKKVRPPDDIVNAELLNARHNKVHTEVGNMLMKILGNDIVLGIMAEIGVPSYDLDSVLAGRPEQHWQYLVQRAGQTGVDFEQAVKRAIIKTRPDLAGLLG